MRFASLPLLALALLMLVGSACEPAGPVPLPTRALRPTPPEASGPAADYGDAPDPSFPSLFASDGARTLDISQFWLGETQEPSATTEVNARVTDQDELDDGLESFGAQGGTTLLRFRAVKSTSATAGRVYFNVLADLNSDGEWRGRNEWVAVNREVDLAPGSSQWLEVEVRLPESGEVWIRAALTDTAVAEAQFPDGWDGTGQFSKGEVEDYLRQALPPDIPTPTPTDTPTPTPTQTPTPTATPTPKYILTGISVTHSIREGAVHLRVHVRVPDYEGQIFGKEIFFDGRLVERLFYDFPILPQCQPSDAPPIPFQGDPPKVIEIHFLDRNGNNLGSVSSQLVA